MKRLIADIAISAFATLIVLLIFGGGSGGGGGITGGAIIFALVLVLLAPFLLLTGLALSGYLASKAIKYRRPGLIVGPLLVVTVAPLVAGYRLHRDTEAIEALIVKPFFTPSSPYHVVMMDGPERKCDTLCKQILASGRFEVVRGGVHYRLVPGDACLTSVALADSALEFAEAGYSDFCASEVDAVSLSPALRVVTRSVDDRTPYALVPSSFRGHVGELYEPSQTGERLLGRWIGGTIESRVPAPLLFLAHLAGMRFDRRVGDRFSQADFYAAALGFELTRNEHPGQSSNRALIDRVTQLAPLVSNKESALRLQAALAQHAGPDVAGPLMLRMIRSHKQTEVDRGIRMLTSLPPETQRAAIPDLLAIAKEDDLVLAQAAIGALGRLPAEDLVGLKDQMIGFIRGPSEPISAAALSAVANSRAPDCGFLEAELTDLAFNARFEDEDDPILYPLMKAIDCLPRAFPLETQERARQRFMDPALSRGEMWMMIRVMAHRNPDGHDAAFAMIAALPSPRFEDAVEAVLTKNQPAMIFVNDQVWSDKELQQLVERTGEVPAALLMKYVDTIYDQTSRNSGFRAIKPRLSEILKMRQANAATSDDAATQQQIESVMRRFHFD